MCADLGVRAPIGTSGNFVIPISVFDVPNMGRQSGGMVVISGSEAACMAIIPLLKSSFCDTSVCVGGVIFLCNCSLVYNLVSLTFSIHWADLNLVSTISARRNFRNWFLLSEYLAVVLCNFSFEVRHALVRYFDRVSVHDFS